MRQHAGKGVDVHTAGDEDDLSQQGGEGEDARRREDEGAAGADGEVCSGGGGGIGGEGERLLPEPCGGRVGGRALDGELEVAGNEGGAVVGGRFVWCGARGRGRDGEAAGLGDVGDVDVEPLAWEELGGG